MIAAVVRFFIVVLLFTAAVIIPVLVEVRREDKRRAERTKQQARAAKLAAGDQCPAALGKVDNKCHLCRYYGGQPELFVILCYGVNRRAKQ